MVDALYCWQVFCLSVISKNKDFPEKKLKFHCLTSKTPVNIESFFSSLACTDKNFSSQWM